MTLEQYFQLTGYLLYPGQDDAYRGQCVQSVMIKIKQVDGVEPPVYPDAKDYWFNGIPGYSVTTNPQSGDIAVYNGHDSFPEGHIAVVAPDGQVFEQNADPDGSPMHFATRATTYLLGYLTKGEDMGALADQGGVNTLFYAYLGRAPAAQDASNIGRPWQDVIYDLAVSQEHADYVNRYNAGQVAITELAQVQSPKELTNGIYKVG